MVEKGLEIDLDLFGAFVARTAVVKNQRGGNKSGRYY